MSKKILYKTHKVCTFQKSIPDIKRKKLESRNAGKNEMEFIESIGITHIDLMQFIRQQHKLDMYKLDFVAKHFVNLEILNISENEDSLVL